MAKSSSQLELLEQKLNLLLSRFNQINLENSQLRQQIAEMNVEKSHLQNRNESARKQIDMMISRLKSM